MKIVHSIKKFLESFGVSRSVPAKPEVFLRRGPMAIIKSLKPDYIGELVLCTDEPFLAVGNWDSYILIQIPPEAREQFIAHYNRQQWMGQQLFWE